MASTTIKYFAFAHLPAHLQTVSAPIGELAQKLESVLPDGPEKSTGMRKLLEAKDCFVRAALDIPKGAAPANTLHPVEQLAADAGGTITSMMAMPDGSGTATMSLPLPTDHWLTQPGYNEPPMGFRRGSDDPERQEWDEKIRAAARYAVRGATMNGSDNDFDPDALVQNMVVGMLGYFTPDGLSHI